MVTRRRPAAGRTDESGRRGRRDGARTARRRGRPRPRVRRVEKVVAEVVERRQMVLRDGDGVVRPRSSSGAMACRACASTIRPACEDPADDLELAPGAEGHLQAAIAEGTEALRRVPLALDDTLDEALRPMLRLDERPVLEALTATTRPLHGFSGWRHGPRPSRVAILRALVVPRRSSVVAAGPPTASSRTSV